MNSIKIVISENKYGYKSVDLKVGTQTYFLTRSLNRFEINYLANRYNRLAVGVREEKYKDIVYDNLVIYEENGYDNEYVVIKGLDLNVKTYIINQILSDRLGV